MSETISKILLFNAVLYPVDGAGAKAAAEATVAMRMAAKVFMVGKQLEYE